MVLKTIIFVLFSSILMVQDGAGALFSKYEVKLKKEILKIFKDKTNDDFTVENLKFESKFLEVYSISSPENPEGFLFVKEVKACSLNGCVSIEVINDNIASEYFDISVITDKDLNIQSVKVLDYFSDYGYEISSRRYLKQFSQKNLCEISAETPQVDGISGATISYNALINSIEEFCTIQK